jgi:hypothetical protein
MISPGFRLAEFLEAVQGRSFLETSSLTQQELRELDALLRSGCPGVTRARHSAAPEYRNNLQGLAFLLQSGRRPRGVSEGVFQSFRPIIQSLVDRGELLPSALPVFDEAPYGYP